MQIRNFTLMDVLLYICIYNVEVGGHIQQDIFLIWTDMFFMLVVAHEEFDSRPFRCKDINENKTINFYHSKKQKQTSVMLNDIGRSILSKTAYRVIL